MERRIQNMVAYRFRNYSYISLKHQKKLFPLLVRVLPAVGVLLTEDGLWESEKKLDRNSQERGTWQIALRISKLANGASEEQIVARMEALTEEEMLDLYKLLQVYCAGGPVIIREIQGCLLGVMVLRMDALEKVHAANKKRNCRNQWYCKIGGVAILILLLVMIIMPKKAVPFSKELKDGTRVYADVVFVEPNAVSASSYLFNGVSQYKVDGVFCSGTTVSGEKIGMYITVNDYMTYFDPDAVFQNPVLSSADSVKFSSPIRIYGIVRNRTAFDSHAPKTSKVFLFSSMEA